MSKLLPKKFGEKLDVDTHIDLVARVKAMTPQQRLERAAELLEEGRRYLPLLARFRAEKAAKTIEDEDGQSTEGSITRTDPGRIC